MLVAIVNGTASMFVNRSTPMCYGEEWNATKPHVTVSIIIKLLSHISVSLCGFPIRSRACTYIRRPAKKRPAKNIGPQNVKSRTLPNLGEEVVAAETRVPTLDGFSHFSEIFMIEI